MCPTSAERPRLLFLLLLALIIPLSVHAAGPMLIDGLAPDAYGTFDANLCRGCDADRALTGLCQNDCTVCQDDGRPTFAGDNTTIGCSQFNGNQAACEDAWQRTEQNVPFSCFYQAGLCTPCVADSQIATTCTNSCLPCQDGARITFAGGSFPDSCRTYDGNQATCETAYQLASNGIPLTCFYAAGECHVCGVAERLSNACTNSCVTCDDPARTTYTNGFGDDGCVALSENETACESTWYLANGYVPAQCFYYDGTEVNQAGFLFIQDGFDRVGPLVTNGKKVAVCIGCNGTTATGGFEHGFDESTLPDLGWSRTTITELDAIDAFLAGTGTPKVGDAGLIYMPSQQTDTPHNGITQEQVAAVNARSTELATFVAGGGGLFVHAQGRLERGFAWLGAVLPGVSSRNGNTCREGLELTPTGVSRFPNVSDAILQTLNNDSPGYFIGSAGSLEILAEDQCRDVTCKNPAHTTALGGPDSTLCTTLAGDAGSCNEAWYLDRNGHAAVCLAEMPTTCIGCGRNEFGEDPCPNDCSGCDDTTRTIFTGDLSSSGCEFLADDQASCAIAWQGAGDGLNASCFFDADAGFCRVCSTENENLGLCSNSCEEPPATRTVVLGPGGTTTTTLPGGCEGPDAATFESIICRLERLVALVKGAQDLGKTKAQLERASVKALDKTRAAQGLVGGKRKKVKNSLHKGSRKIVSFNFRVRSRNGQKIIPQATRDALLGLGEPILRDMKILLKSL
ncbi:MAG TPA: hypothetical protein VGR62_20360 [Candidatus Binatia bacterium]|jgi:hypothetical protein|nr:hypothetical protein [Candidatus Binatia bacterium]